MAFVEAGAFPLYLSGARAITPVAHQSCPLRPANRPVKALAPLTLWLPGSSIDARNPAVKSACLRREGNHG